MQVAYCWNTLRCHGRFHAHLVLDLVRNRNRKPANAFTQHLRCRIREVEPHVRAGIALSKERLSRDKSYVVLDRLVKQAHAIDASRQRHPQEKPSLRMRPLHLGWEEVIKCCQHRITPRFVALADGLNVLVQEAVLGDLIYDHLCECAGMKIGGLFELNEPCDDVRWRNDPTQPESRSQDL